MQWMIPVNPDLYQYDHSTVLKQLRKSVHTCLTSSNRAFAATWSKRDEFSNTIEIYSGSTFDATR